MAGINPGRNAGRLSIRVIPNTNDFRDDLRKRLAVIERTTTMTVRVNKANLDKTKIRADIRRQMEGFEGIEANVNVGVTIDKAKLRKKTLRASIQKQFDQFEDIRVNIAAQIQNHEHFQKEVREMVRKASRNNVRVNANAATLAASAQLKLITRDRFVNLIVRVTSSSATAALTTLAALSGARLSWQWIDSLATSMKNLDKNLPALLGWTTGITSLVASLFSATSGLVGIGQGLFSILPAFLVIPGLILNAAGSLTALIVALKNAGTELGSLKGSMTELGDIINDAFWTQARQPILDLVNGLMPQLRNSFRELSTGIGQFTGELAKAFGSELGGGGLEKIFSGIAEGWRVLSTGAPAFAGAMVSLSQVAAKYTPRLAAWFVRQANTFDNWLEAVSTDGRLDGWMEGAIKSMYDLWDATTGIAGVFEGLWTAADSAGSKGLAGFADMMQEWERIVKGADFQRGLTAVFRGSHVAMNAFGDAVRAIGRMVLGLDTSIEKFIGTAGAFFGGLIEGAANALNQPAVDAGLLELSTGLVKALQGILPHLPVIAATFGEFLGLLGELASTVLPAAAGVFADLMPIVSSLIDVIKPVLGPLSTSLSEFSSIVAPAIEGFVKAVSPSFKNAMRVLGDAMVDIAPGIADLASALGPVVINTFDALARALEVAAPILREALHGAADLLTGASTKTPEGRGDSNFMTGLGEFLAFAGQLSAFGNFGILEIPAILTDPAGWMQGILDGSKGVVMAEIGRWFTETIGLPITQLFANAVSWLLGPGSDLVEGFYLGAQEMWTVVSEWFRTTFPSVVNFFDGAITWLTGPGMQILTGLLTGITGGWRLVSLWFTAIPPMVRGFLYGAGSWLYNSGRSLIGGFIEGINSMLAPLRAVVGAAMKLVGDFFPHSPAKTGPFSGAGWTRVKTSGGALGAQFTSGIRDSIARSMPEAMSTGWGAAGLKASANVPVDLSAIGSAVAATAAAATTQGDSINFYGVTTDTAAAEIGTAIETKKRRRINRTGALRKAGVR